MQYHLHIKKGFMPEIQARFDMQQRSPFFCTVAIPEWTTRRRQVSRIDTTDAFLSAHKRAVRKETLRSEQQWPWA